MTTKALVKAIEKKGVKVTTEDGHRYYAASEKRSITFYNQAGSAICVNVKRHNDISDPNSDYFAGSYYDTIKGAVSRLIEV